MFKDWKDKAGFEFDSNNNNKNVTYIINRAVNPPAFGGSLTPPSSFPIARSGRLPPARVSSCSPAAM